MDILSEIIEQKKCEVKELKSKFTLTDFEGFEFFESKCLPVYDEFFRSPDLSIIAEIKKASPSKGIIREDFDPINIADIYMSNGAGAISVLTDEKYFKGKIEYLSEIAKIKTVPLLRKDFIIDEIQVHQSKAYGADIILLIAEVLSAQQINELILCAFELGLEVLLEIHSSDQLPKIDFTKNKIIGINNRDLKTFNTSIETTVQLSKVIPKQVLVVSESGISEEKDVYRIKNESNAKAVLVGEHFMRHKDLAAAFDEFKNWCKNEG